MCVCVCVCVYIHTDLFRTYRPAWDVAHEFVVFHFIFFFLVQLGYRPEWESQQCPRVRALVRVFHQMTSAVCEREARGVWGGGHTETPPWATHELVRELARTRAPASKTTSCPQTNMAHRELQLCVCVCVCVCMQMQICMYTRTHVCVCVCVCIYLLPNKHSPPRAAVHGFSEIIKKITNKKNY